MSDHLYTFGFISSRTDDMLLEDISDLMLFKKLPYSLVAGRRRRVGTILVINSPLAGRSILNEALDDLEGEFITVQDAQERLSHRRTTWVDPSDEDSDDPRVDAMELIDDWKNIWPSKITIDDVSSQPAVSVVPKPSSDKAKEDEVASVSIQAKASTEQHEHIDPEDKKQAPDDLLKSMGLDSSKYTVYTY